MSDDDLDSSLILAAEECQPDKFEALHRFTSHDDLIIRKLSAHGPVLIRGGRGSGKSALMIEAQRRMQAASDIFPVYVSLRYLPLLQSDGDEYIGHFCILLSVAIQKEITARNFNAEFGSSADQLSIQLSLTRLSQVLNRRIVLLFDDAAHIGREKPLEVFFDLFRTLSSNLTSCKASIYPGVTKFGVRFDVFNDSTVIDISRSDVSNDASFFPDVLRARYPRLADKERFSDRLSPEQFANLLGRAVVGNLRGFILACNRFDDANKVGIPEINKCLLNMATDYYWPLMDEVAPKLGVYEPLIEPAREAFEALIAVLKERQQQQHRGAPLDKVLVHRQIVSNYAKLFEILEYLGFMARREASRAMKSGGRGPVYALNLCNLIDGGAVPSRLTSEMINVWLEGSTDPAEIHISGSALQNIRLPALTAEKGLTIIDRPVSDLAKSPAYPYGLTADMITRLREAKIETVGQLAAADDATLDAIEYFGAAKIKRIRAVVQQAIWM
ncbi:hypothetical protein [Tardiphaga robiniae]|uniref:hypothetical protein n=1 Tax=Tardiphaga robiniae TaxID=943830 RepID=UPI00158669F0|nr:hypothetical protein [Tardiphaga robiniae]NUU44379.1 hypothetical protein [Tardiphaga robiniae]